MNYQKIKTIKLLGIGGGAVFYVAKFFHYLNTDVFGYEISKSNETKELEQLGISIQYSNPSESFEKDTDLYIYSKALPKTLRDNISKMNPNIPSIEVGEFFDQITKGFENNKLSKIEIKAFYKSNIAPLYKVDTSKMKYIGVTGTDGKTSTSTMIYHILKETGYKPALITTVSAIIGDKEVSTGLHTTTPSSQVLADLISHAEKENCTHIIIEATSHGLAMGRLSGLKFDIATYTNITPEHLDYHKTYKNLVKAKARLITDHLKTDGKVILNYDHKKSFNILSHIVNNYTSYSIIEKSNYDSEFIASKIKETKKGYTFEVGSYKTKLNILGKYNISNMLAALATTSEINIPLKKTIKTIGSFKTVKGRMEVVQEVPYKVIVDFAHTPNALESALRSVKETTKNRLIVIFGCAGQRDPSKRFPMGASAAKYADITILTAEDPRFENLKEINDEIEKGWESIKSKGKLFRFDDDSSNIKVRKDAILKALEIVQDGDTILIAGKGHEESLCFNNIDYKWNDIDEVKKILKP